MNGLRGNYQNIKKSKLSKFINDFKGYNKYLALTIMFIPVILYFVVFKYVPMYGIIIAFKDFKMTHGIGGSLWVGLDNFKFIFNQPSFLRSFKNTIIISFFRLLAGFPAPILLAILLNEITNLKFKKVTQTISYLPHFLSWVVLSGVLIQLLSPTSGAVNYILSKFGIEPIFFMADNKWFRFILVISDIWKSMGWGSIIYLASIAGISTSLYEAAESDGASRFQKIYHITIPSLAPTITILLILKLGYIMSAGFDQIFNMYNPSVYETSDILDTFVYRSGLKKMQYSFATATGLFKNVIGFVLVITTNAITKRINEYGLW